MADIRELIELLLSEYKDKMTVAIPDDVNVQRLMYNSLVSVRAPGLNGVVNQAYLKLQNEFLQEEIFKQGIVLTDSLLSVCEEFNIPTKKVDPEAMMKPGARFTLCHSDKISLYKGDITSLKVDMIVNAADPNMLGCFTPNHISVDSRIHLLAGVELRAECDEIVKRYGRGLRPGEARVTKGYNLNCDYIAHTAGPLFRGQITDQIERELTSCYQASMKEAEKLKLKTIAFPVISTGDNGYPLDAACNVALQAIDEYFDEADTLKKAVIVAYDEDAYYAVLGSIKDAI
ncbi:MAG: macro domain-containing protein [Lachnospiraceae bacterium]|nr:macro domain-containing protein [Lachnospiraceae bacterium]